MTKQRGWFESTRTKWIGVAVSLAMLVLYIQRLMEPNPEASTPYVTAAWGLMFVIWLAAAIYTTWLRRD